MIDNETRKKAEYIQHSFRTEDYSTSSDSLISGNGDLSFNGSLRINGIFSGKLKVSGSLTVGINARITGDVVANDLIVLGRLAGTVQVVNKAIFQSTSAFSGTLTADDAEFHTGCKISGKRTIFRTIEKEPFSTLNTQKLPGAEPTPKSDEISPSSFRL